VAASEIVGREAELAALEPFLETVATVPSALLFEGEAGIGKTTLWQAGVDAAIGRSFRVMSCGAAQSETKLPFTGLGDLFAHVPEEAFYELPPQQRHAVDLALLRAEAEGPPADPRAVSVAVLSVLRFLAEAGPVVLAVDDVQWLDGSSAGALGFVARRLREEPIGILGSVRGSPDQAAPLGLDRATAQVRRVPVAALTASTLGSIIAARQGTRLSRSTLRELHRISGGNPFYALEIARALQRRGAELTPGEELPIRSSLTELLAERLAGLPGRTHQALAAVSAMATPSRAVAEALAMGKGAGGALDRAERAGIVEIDGDRVSFTHPLLAAHVYAQITAGRKRDLHRRLANLVPNPEERALHMALGAAGPDQAVAGALEEAGHRAVARGAPNTGADLLERAYRLTPPEAGDEARRRALAALAHYEACGLFALGGRLCEELLASWPPDIPRGRVLYRLAEVRPSEWADLLRQALLESGGDLALETDAHVRLAYALWNEGSWEGSEWHDREAVRLAEQIGDRAVIANALLALASDWVVAGRGIPQDLIDRYLALEDDSPEWRLDVAHVYYPHFFMWTDRLAEAREGYERILAVAREGGAEVRVFQALSGPCELEFRCGNFERSIGLATEMAGLVPDPDDVLMWAVLHRLACAESHLGRVEEARTHERQAIEILEQLGPAAAVSLMSVQEVLGFIELSLGNPAAALEFSLPAIAAMRQTGFGEPGLLTVVPDGIEALIAVGRLEGAKELLEWWEERSRATDRPFGLSTSARCRGLLLASLGDAPGALDALEEALRQHERIPDQPFELGRTLLVLGEVQRRARKRRAARASLQQAREIFDRCGAALWVKRAEAELRRIGGRPRAPLDLTPTEERVAALVAAGRTNKEVAAALFVSLGTVEDNLRKIYRKLGVRSRTELALRASARPDPREGSSSPTQ
jgi:DNA-binding CsgD family transcriptional regulator